MILFYIYLTPLANDNMVRFYYKKHMVIIIFLLLFN